MKKKLEKPQPPPNVLIKETDDGTGKKDEAWIFAVVTTIVFVILYGFFSTYRKLENTKLQVVQLQTENDSLRAVIAQKPKPSQKKIPYRGWEYVPPPYVPDSIWRLPDVHGEWWLDTIYGRRMPL